jgi:hypothetical protein
MWLVKYANIYWPLQMIHYNITVTCLCVVLNIKYKPVSNSFPFPFAWQIFHSWHTTTASSKCRHAAVHTAQSHTQQDLSCCLLLICKQLKEQQDVSTLHLWTLLSPYSTNIHFPNGCALPACWQNSNATSSTLPLSRYPSVFTHCKSPPPPLPQHSLCPSSIFIHIYIIYPIFQHGYSSWTTRLLTERALRSFKKSGTTYPMKHCHIPELHTQ